MRDVAERVLEHLEGTGGLVDSLLLSKELGEDHQRVVGAIKSLQALGGLIDVEQKTTAKWELTPEGRPPHSPLNMKSPISRS